VKKALKAFGGLILWFLLFALIGGVLETFLNQDLAYTIGLIVAIPLTIFLMKKGLKFRSIKSYELKKLEDIDFSLNESESVSYSKKDENNEQCTIFFEECNSGQKIDAKTEKELVKGSDIAPIIKAICGNYVYVVKQKELRGFLSESIEVFEKFPVVRLVETFGAFQSVYCLKVFGKNEFLAFSASKDEYSDPVVYLYEFDQLLRSFSLVKKFFSLPLSEVEGLYKVENEVYPVLKQFNFPMGKTIHLLVKGEERIVDEFGEHTYRVIYDFFNPYEGVSKKLVQIFIDSLLKVGYSDLRGLSNDYELSKSLEDYLENSESLTLNELEFIYTTIKSMPHAFYTKYFVLSKLYKRLLALKKPPSDLLEEIEDEIYSLPEVHKDKKVKTWKSYALREIGECVLETLNDKEKALSFLEKALELNNKVGVKRLVKSLRKEIGLTATD